MRESTKSEYRARGREGENCSKLNRNIGYQGTPFHHVYQLRKQIIETQDTRVEPGHITCCLIGLMIGHASATELPKEGVLSRTLATKATHTTMNKYLVDG